MAVDFNLKDDEKQLSDQEREQLVKKAVHIPSGSFCRFLLYDIDSPSKAKEEAKKTKIRLSIMQGLIARLAVVSFFDEQDKEQIVIDYSDTENIKLPLGETGFKSFLYFSPVDWWCRKEKFEIPEDEVTARKIFNLYIEKYTGIPYEMEKGSTGILFNGFRTMSEYTPTTGVNAGKKQINVHTSVYNKLAKKRLEPVEIDVQTLAPEITARIWGAIDPDGFAPMG